MSSLERVKGGVKAKFPGRRGYSYFNQQRSTTLASATAWVRRTWVEIENDGGLVIQAYLTPEGGS